MNRSTRVISSGPDLQLVQNAPEAGQWRFVLIVVNPVTGAEVSQAFSGVVGFNEAEVSSNLPDSSSSTLTAGQATSYTIGYGNPGAVPEPVQVDPRLQGSTSLTLPSLSGAQTVTLPLSVSKHFPRSALRGAAGHEPAHGGGHVQLAVSAGTGRAARRTGRTR